MQANENLTSLDQFIEQEHGATGTKPREEFEAGYETFKLGMMLQQARRAKGLTQAQLAELSGTDKAYISKLENDLKDVRLSTLQRIIADGLGGHLEFSIKY
ncbi:helix-turn-helix domain-containing protein [Hymenobacter psoromatis]|uniref:helix-turn-helix domain-containing protein n=1 Tax=Hymenobacter psoromatis TaxID=1484116 RepID=UPI001CBF242F|nr:helix-turn-helix transcriptional regulator [Hymenobacter psoromatis]